MSVLESNTSQLGDLASHITKSHDAAADTQQRAMQVQQGVELIG